MEDCSGHLVGCFFPRSVADEWHRSTDRTSKGVVKGATKELKMAEIPIGAEYTPTEL